MTRLKTAFSLPPATLRNVNRLLRRREVMNLVGLPKSTFDDMIRRGDFPSGVRISKRVVVWDEAEIQKWWKSKAA